MLEAEGYLILTATFITEDMQYVGWVLESQSQGQSQSPI
jgi:hypothetical protein